MVTQFFKEELGSLLPLSTPLNPRLFFSSIPVASNQNWYMRDFLGILRMVIHGPFPKTKFRNNNLILKPKVGSFHAHPILSNL